MNTCVHIYIYIYIYVHIYIYIERERERYMKQDGAPNLLTKVVPAKIC